MVTVHSYVSLPEGKLPNYFLVNDCSIFSNFPWIYWLSNGREWFQAMSLHIPNYLEAKQLAFAYTSW